MWSLSLRNPVNSKRIFSAQPWREYTAPKGNEEILIVEDYVTAYGVFRAVTRSTAGTTTIATPKSAGSIAITDIILSATKVNNATASLVFDDDTNDETLFTVATTNQPANITHTVKGRMQGWRDARLDLVTVNSTVVFVTVIYLHLPAGLPYVDWNTLR